MFAAILGAVVLHQPIRAYTWVAIAVAVAGMAWMFANGLGAGLSGTLIAFAIPVAAAVNVVTLRKWGRSVDLAPAVLLGGAFSALIALPFALPFESSAHDLAWLAALGMFQLAVPCMMLVVASRHLPPAEVALLTLLEAVLGPIWAWQIVGERPAAATLAGGGIVLAGDRRQRDDRAVRAEAVPARSSGQALTGHRSGGGLSPPTRVATRRVAATRTSAGTPCRRPRSSRCTGRR